MVQPAESLLRKNPTRSYGTNAAVRCLTRASKVGLPTFADHVPTREALLSCTQQLFGWAESGQPKVNIGQRYPLAEAAKPTLTLLLARRQASSC
jgi:NADPH:quinone reductase-like Zn-dependent oxidoreductase